MQEALILLSSFNGRNFIYLWEFFRFAQKLGYSVKKARYCLAWLHRNGYVEWQDYGKTLKVLKHVEIKTEKIQTKNYDVFEYEKPLTEFIK